MHAAGFAQKETDVRSHDGMENRRVGLAGGGVFQSVLQDSESGISRVGTLDRLFKLRLVAEEDEVLRTSSYRNGVG